MFKQYFKQAIHALRENRLTSLVSILGRSEERRVGKECAI